MLVQKAAPYRGGTRIFPARGLLGDLADGPLVRGQARMATHCEGACFHKRAVNLGPIQTTVIDCCAQMIRPSQRAGTGKTVFR